MKRVLLIVGLGIAMNASADILHGTPEFSWTMPTKNVDGSDIPATGTGALKEFRLYCDGGSVPKNITAMPTLAWTAPLGAFAVGAHSCNATAVSNGGAESARSNPVNFTIPVSAPEKPTVNVQ